MKKHFVEPMLSVVMVDSSDIIATSTGATGEDAPWGGGRRRAPIIDDYYEDEE